MKKIFLIFTVSIFYFSNVYGELTVKIDRAEIGALPIMIHIAGEEEKLGVKIKNIIETDLYNSGYFNILNSKNVKNNVSSAKTQYALWTLAGANYVVKSKIYLVNAALPCISSWKNTSKGLVIKTLRLSVARQLRWLKRLLRSV